MRPGCAAHGSGASSRRQPPCDLRPSVLARPRGPRYGPRAMDWIYQVDAWVALLTLTVLEIVLGIDNLVFISIQSGRLPPEQRSKARR